MADQQTELLREILDELKALRQDQRQTDAQLAASGERVSRLLARWDSDGFPGSTSA